MNFKKYQKGFNLVEAMLAISILTITAGGTLQVINSLQKNKETLKAVSARDQSYVNITENLLYNTGRVAINAAAQTSTDFARCVQNYSECPQENIGGEVRLDDMGTFIAGTSNNPRRINSMGINCSPYDDPQNPCIAYVIGKFARKKSGSHDYMEIWSEIKPIPNIKYKFESITTKRQKVAIADIKAICDKNQILVGFTQEGQPRCIPSACPDGYSLSSINPESGKISCINTQDCAFNEKKGQITIKEEGNIIKNDTQCIVFAQNTCSPTQEAIGISIDGIECRPKSTGLCGGTEDSSFNSPKVLKGLQGDGSPICVDGGVGSGHNCPREQVQVGIENDGRPICRNLVTSPGTFQCGEDQMIRSIGTDGKPECVSFPLRWDYNNIYFCSRTGSPSMGVMACGVEDIQERCPDFPHTKLCAVEDSFCYIEQEGTKFYQVVSTSETNLTPEIMYSVSANAQSDTSGNTALSGIQLNVDIKVPVALIEIRRIMRCTRPHF